MDRDRYLRERLVSYLQHAHVLRDARIVAAFRSVPRHRFVPEHLSALAYEDRALVLKERGGVVLSSISQPAMIAQMLEMLNVQPGAHVLEIGTGSGYNAALLSELVGPHGSVVSVELEADLAEHARSLFKDLGYSNIETRVADAKGLELTAQFERIVATVCVRDIPVAWWSALEDAGRIVVPLNLSYGGERVVAFVRDGNRLRSVVTQACSFIGMRGGGEPNSGEIFFRNAAARYLPEPDVHTALSIVAVRANDAAPELLETADVVVARQDTFFAITRLTQS